MYKLNKSEVEGNINKPLLEFTNSLVEKVSKNIENFNYNVIVANFHEAYNFLNNQIDKNTSNQILKESYIKINFLLISL